MFEFRRFLKKRNPLLKRFMQEHSKATRKQILKAFSHLNGDIEFATWTTTDPEALKAIHEIAKIKHIAIWRNTDKNSTFLYGTTDTSFNSADSVKGWVRDITIKEKKAIIRIGNEEFLVKAHKRPPLSA